MSTPTLSPNARLATDVFAEVAKGNGAAFWEECHDDLVWRTIGTGSWSGEYRLLSATNVIGPWTWIQSATSPYTNALGGPQRFFKLSGP